MKENDVKIQQAFAQPQWYLSSTAYNITIRMETVREYLSGANKCTDILDIGCGNGSLSLQLLDSQTHLTLLDGSAEMLQTAASRIPEGLKSNVKIIQDNFLTADLGVDNFDLIICVGVLAYVEDLKTFVGRLVTSLKPGGSLIVECSDATHFVRRTTRAYDSLRRIFGAKNFDTVRRSSDAVIAAFAAHGFSPRHAFRYSQPLPGIRKLLSQKASYKAVRLVHGSGVKNRASWLGSECIYHFVRKG